MFHPNLKIIPILAILPGMLMAAPIKQIESNVPVEHVYAPAGFDSNDNAEIVVSGFLPNLCYKAPKSHVEIKGDKINVGIKALKNLGGLSFCADVIVPYIEIVNIGLLDQGKYKLAINENSQYEKKVEMKVAEASSNSIDDAIYANVSEIEKVEGSRKVILKGYNPSDCFELDKVEIVDNGVDVYSVLPKLKQVRDFCPKKMVEFSYDFQVPEKLEADRVLLHVRVMDGKSMNALFNNKSPAEE
jgi:hypothetical protein